MQQRFAIRTTTKYITIHLFIHSHDIRFSCRRRHHWTSVTKALPHKVVWMCAGVCDSVLLLHHIVERLIRTTFQKTETVKVSNQPMILFLRAVCVRRMKEKHLNVHFVLLISTISNLQNDGVCEQTWCTLILLITFHFREKCLNWNNAIDHFYVVLC